MVQINRRDVHATVEHVGELVELNAVAGAVDVLGLGQAKFDAGNVVLGQRDRVGVRVEDGRVVVDVVDVERENENVVEEHVVEFHRQLTFRAGLVVRAETVAVDALADGDQIARGVEDEQW